MKKLLIKLINFYQASISVLFFNGVCKYEVSCSQYTKQKIIDAGMVRGSLMGIKRIWSCR